MLKLVFNSSASAEKSNKVGINMYYRGLKFVILGLKILLILQSVHKVKLNLSSSFFLTNLTLVKQKYSENSRICYILESIIF